MNVIPIDKNQRSAGRRLKHLTPSDWEEWGAARQQAGAEKYGDSHLNRYNLVDMAEEVLDSLNILALFVDRMITKHGEDEVSLEFLFLVERFSVLQGKALRVLCDIDELLPDACVTDEEGGERIWWSKKKREEEER